MGRVAEHCELLKIEGNDVEMRVKFNPRARRLIVKVHPASGEVTVIAPSRPSLAGAVEFARGQSEWIAEQLASVPQRVVLRIGTHIPLRGIDHIIVAAADNRAAVKADFTTNQITVGGRAEHHPRRIMDFLKQQARRDFEARVCHYAAPLGVHPRRIVMRDTQSRWGSCSTTRTLSFSWRLILAPSFVLDYVAAHEVAHLREMNHGPRFWKLVSQMVADVQTPQQWLRTHGMELHRYGA